MKLQHFLILISLTLLPSSIFSQNIEKPKIGLVLSGGGAKGIAHLGVLHALDSLNIKPDYITGTSMGSIMGALYAIGYSADQIDSILSVADWEYVLSDDIPLIDIETNKKNTYQKSLLYFNFSGNIVPKLPAGIVYGQHISEYFSKLTWKVAGIDDFNDFEIPYKCVSADLISGKPWFFDKGDLATAMRSSMSIPTVFSPMKVDTLLLIDGGVYRNFPVIDAKEMGAEIIIGSYTGFEESVTFEDMHSLTNVLVRSSTFSGIQDIKVQEEMCDYYIKYDLHGLGTKDFKKGKEIIEYGKQSMNSSSTLDSLIVLSKKLSKYPDTNRIKIHERDSITIAGIKTNGLTMINNDYMVSKSGLNIGSKISKDDMTVALNSMMGTLMFDKITYTLSKDKNSNNKDSFIITFDVIEKARGQLDVSLNYDNFFGPSFISNFLVRNLVLDGSETRLNLYWSENPMVHFNYDMFFGKRKRIQTSLYAKYEVAHIKSFFDFGDEFGNLNIGTQINTKTETALNFAYNFNANNQLGAELSYQISTLKYKEGADIATEISGGSEYGSSLKFYFEHNNVNKQFYPTSGYKLYLASRLGSEFKRTLTLLNLENYEERDSVKYLPSYLQLELRYKHLIELGSKVSLQPGISIGISSNEVSTINRYTLGGNSRINRINNLKMIGSNPYSIITDNYLMATLDLQYNFIDKLYLTFRTNATLSLYYDEYSSEFIEKDHIAAGVSLGYNSPFGPIDTGYYINKLGKSYWHVNIGFPF